MRSQTEMYNEAQALVNRNEDQAAIDALEGLLNRYPDDSRARIDLGLLHHKMGNAKIALDQYQKATALETENIEFLKILADYYYVELKDVTAALVTHKKILDIEPNDVDSLTIAGNLCLCEHDWDAAEHYYQRVQEIEPWRFEIQEYLDKLASRKENPGSRKGSDATMLYQSSQECVDAGDLPGAIQLLEKIIEIDPGYALAYNDIGVIYYQMGEREKTFEYYQLATQKMPDNHIFLKNIADFYCYEHGNLHKALPIYLKILNEEPADIEVLMTMGAVNLRLDRLADAKVFFDRVLDIEPWNIEANEQLERFNSADSPVS